MGSLIVVKINQYPIRRLEIKFLFLCINILAKIKTNKKHSDFSVVKLEQSLQCRNICWNLSFNKENYSQLMVSR